MANAGKFKDRMPGISAAGVPSQPAVINVAKCLEEIHFADQVNALLADYEKKELFEYPLPQPNKERFNLYDTQVKQLISPAVKTSFQSFCDELQNTSYRSYWNLQVGRRADPTPALPIGMDPKTTVMGKPSGKQVESGDVINPRLTASQVLMQSSIGKELYKVSHNSLEPGERKYSLEGVVDPDTTFGVITKHGDSGSGAKMCTQWFDQSRFSSSSKMLSAFKFRHQHKLGEAQKPNGNAEILGPYHTYGKPSGDDLYGACEVVSGTEPSIDKMNLTKSLAYVNGLRTTIKKKDPPITYQDFMYLLNYKDVNKTGVLSVDDLTDVCHNSGIKINFDLIDILLERTKAKTEKGIDYNIFTRILLPDQEFPEIERIRDVPESQLHYETQYQVFMKDYENKSTTDCQPIAGSSSKQLWTLAGSINHVPKADLCHLGTETKASTCLNPHIFTHYGLSHRDFFRPRSKDFIRALFNSIGTEISDQVFEELWQEGLKRDNTGFVCVETFRNILSEVVAARFAQIFKQ